MNKMTPQIRFQGFTDDWEERKFFESMASTIDFRGRTPKKLGMDWSESGYLALSALNVKNGYGRLQELTEHCKLLKNLSW